jgi:hypothetical protein
LRPDDEAALAAPLRSSKPDESESGRLHGSKKNSLFLLTFLIFWTAWELHKKQQKTLIF